MEQLKKQLLFFFSTVVLLSAITTITSCEKEAGEGGNSTITGKVYARDYDEYFMFLEAEYYAHDEDVFIIYGDGTTPDDRIRTGPDGDFKFPYLRPGKYRIYVYSDDSTFTMPSGETAIYREVEITKNKEKVDVGTMIILKH